MIFTANSSFFDFEYVRMGNFWYVFFIVLCLGLTALTLFICRKAGKKFSKVLIQVLLWSNFALHFLKQFIPYYFQRWPVILVDSLFPNLCAILIVTAPFIYLWGNAYFKDYFFYIGTVSGLGVLFYPSGPMDIAQYPGGFFSNPDYLICVARFYLCHFLLLVTALIMVLEGFHKINYRRLWAIPFIYALYLGGVSLNSIMLGPVFHHPWYPQDWVGPDGVFNPRGEHSVIANQSMNFGPQPFLDNILSPIYPYLPQGLMTYKVGDQYYFVPVLWQLPFIALATLLAGPLMALPFDYQHMRDDRYKRQQLRRWKKMARRARKEAKKGN